MLGDAAEVTGNIVQQDAHPVFPFNVAFVGLDLGATVGGHVKITGGALSAQAPFATTSENKVEGSITCKDPGTVFPLIPDIPPDCSDWDGDGLPDGTIGGHYQCAGLNLACGNAGGDGDDDDDDGDGDDDDDDDDGDDDDDDGGDDDDDD